MLNLEHKWSSKESTRLSLCRSESPDVRGRKQSRAVHPGITFSWKQIQFGEANVRLTFHDNDKTTMDGVDCVMVKPDIDCFKDLGARATFEAISSGLTSSLTNPAQVYVLRWIAGRATGVPEFSPMYTTIG